MAFILFISSITVGTTGETSEPLQENLPPTADAGDDIGGILINDLVEMDGSNSTDEDVDNCSWEWTCTSHPWVEITDSESPIAYFTANFTGEVEFTLTVEDPQGLNSTDDLIVTVDENSDPEPEIHAPLPSGDPYIQGTPIEFSANGSRDPEGRELSFMWKSNVSGDLSQNKFFHTLLDELGWHTIILNVSDPNGGWAIDEVGIYIREPMIEPEAFFSDLREMYYKGDIIKLDGSLSYDGNEGDTLNFTWRTNLTEEVLGYGPIINVTLDEGYHNISLLVTDMDGLTDMYWDHILVKNRLPIAVIDAPSIVNVSQEARLSGFRSLDPDGDELEYLWEFGDGGSEKGMNITYVWTEYGYYNITLTVDDGSKMNSSDNATWRIRINTIPQAYLPEDLRFNVSERFTISANGSFDEDGDELKYRWDFANDGIWDDTGKNGSFVFGEEGEYDVKLEVSDGFAVDTIIVTVLITLPNEDPIALVKGMDDGQIVVPLDDDRGTITIDGSLSYDPDDDVNGNGVIDGYERNNLTFYWDQNVEDDSDGDGIPDNDRDVVGKTMRVTLRGVGPLVVALNVSDERNAWDRINVELVGNNVPTITSIRLDPGETILVDMVGEFTVYADDRDRADRNKLVYTWDMGDGTTYSKSEIEHTYKEAGSYTIRVKVQDDHHNDTQHKTIRVEKLQEPRITYPAEGQDVSGEIEIRGVAYRTAGMNIEEVLISFDGNSYVKCNKRGDWTKWYYLWDTTGREPGTYEIYVKVVVEDAESISTVTVNVGGGSGDEGGGPNLILIGLAIALLLLVLGGIFFIMMNRRKQPELPPPPGPGQRAPVPGVGAPPGPTLPSPDQKNLPKGPEPDEQKKPEKPEEEKPERKDLKVRCPACSNIFKVEDTGERPLKMTCTHCGATGMIEKVPGEEEPEEETTEEEREEEEEKEPVPIICPSCDGLFELTEMTRAAVCPFCGSEGDLDEETLDILRERFGEEPDVVTVRCPRCGRKFSAEEGGEIECPHCGMKGKI
mgnify:CR=1 FL=1